MNWIIEGGTFDGRYTDDTLPHSWLAFRAFLHRERLRVTDTLTLHSDVDDAYWLYHVTAVTETTVRLTSHQRFMIGHVLDFKNAWDALVTDPDRAHTLAVEAELIEGLR